MARLGILLLSISGFVLTGTSRADEVEFVRDILPILSEHCFECHGADLQESDLRLDQSKSLLTGGYSGQPAIIPGDGQGSLLVQVVAEDGADGLIMPPEGEPLSADEIALLTKWIDTGASMPENSTAKQATHESHWSLQPLARPQVPLVQSDMARNAIDLFLIERLKNVDLEFSSEADRRTLIRRLYLVMLGVPPHPREVKAFEEDLRPQAYERLVDRVLADPRFGERWASHWLDLVRFGETHGFETNRERPNAFHYRDYVIEAFNNDLPYDQFVREQIAGDVLGNPVATGFLVAGPYDLVKSPDIALTLMQRQDELADIVNTTGTAFLGLTVGCARCHNHKFDPISQKDYYAMQAVFAGVQHGDREILKADASRERIDELERRSVALQQQLLPYVAEESSRVLTLFADEESSFVHRGVTSVAKVTGKAPLATGTEVGTRSDLGSRLRTGNLSRGYVWFTNPKDDDVLVYRPILKGRYRMWLSWGWGTHTHSSDATYWLDRDGDVNTREDQVLLTTVDQRLPAMAQSEFTTHLDDEGSDLISRWQNELPSQALWSGLLPVEPIDFNPEMKIVLRGGKTGDAVTADLLLFEKIDGEEEDAAHVSRDREPNPFPWQAPANARKNIEWTDRVSARFLRFRILETEGGSQPCLDELEVWSRGQNVALASNGTIAEVSSTLPGYEYHQPSHINDGVYGNERSWISNDTNTGTVTYEFPGTVHIDNVVWGRDRNGRFADRLPTKYVIEVAIEKGEWSTIASHSDRLTPAELKTPPISFMEAAGTESGSSAELDALTQLNRVTEELERLNSPTLAYVGTFAQPDVTHRLYRGDPQSPREAVAPDTLHILDSLELDLNAAESARRLALAESITASDQSLPARVMANRLWQHTFGTGLVETPSDVGLNGVPPTHPELLDWLACELKNDDASNLDKQDRLWSIKRVLRLIVTSHAFRQSAKPHATGREIDANARLLWRFPTRRLTAEAIRDSMLSVSDSLVPQMYGPGFSAFEVNFENVRHYFPKEEYGINDWRRMIYMTKVRQEKDSVFGAFDCPDGSQVQPRRSRSTTPLQALNLFNSEFTLQQANRLAKRVEEETGANASTTDKVRFVYQLVYGREPADDELQLAVEFIGSEIGQGNLQQFCRVLLNSNEFLFIP